MSLDIVLFVGCAKVINNAGKHFCHSRFVIFLVLVVFYDNAKDALVQGGDNVTADSLCTYIASGQRSHKGMCPGLARQYFFMPDTETFIKCTTLLPVPLFIFYQSVCTCHSRHKSFVKMNISHPPPPFLF